MAKVTPHISLRVSKEKLERWQEVCEREDTNVSTVVRSLMDAWCGVKDEYHSKKELVESSVDIEKVKEKYGI